MVFADRVLLLIGSEHGRVPAHGCRPRGISGGLDPPRFMYNLPREGAWCRAGAQRAILEATSEPTPPTGISFRFTGRPDCAGIAYGLFSPRAAGVPHTPRFECVWVFDSRVAVGRNPGGDAGGDYP